MKIRVCSFENRTGTEVYNIVHENHKQYCKHNGYTYYEVNDFSIWPHKVIPHFHKFDLIKDALKDSDYVLYIDFDAVFTNFNMKIEDFIDGSDIIMSKDSVGGRCRYDYGWNNGVILLKNSEKVHRLIDILRSTWIADTFSILQGGRVIHFFDQSAMEAVFENDDTFKGIVKEIPAKSFNSYVAQRAEVGNAWEKDDFILHLPRIQSSRKTEHFKTTKMI